MTRVLGRGILRGIIVLLVVLLMVGAADAITVVEDFESGTLSQVDGNWIISNTRYEGNYGAENKNIGDSESSSMFLSLNVTTDTTISFYQKVSSESGYDFLRVYLDVILKSSISGEIDWQVQTYTITTGIHVLKFEYSKDGSVSSGTDTGYIDYITIACDNCISSIMPPSISSTYTVYPKNHRTYDGSNQFPISISNMSNTSEVNYSINPEIISTGIVEGNNTIYLGTDSGKLFAFDYNNITNTKWTFQANGKILVTPAVGQDGSIYFITSTDLYAVRPDGTLKWNVTTDAVYECSLSLGRDDTIYIGNNTIRQMYAYNPVNGAKKWTFQMSSVPQWKTIVSSVVTDSNDNLYFVMGGKISNNAHDILYSITQGGVERWKITRTESNTGYVAPISAPVIDDSNNLVYVYLHSKLISLTTNGYILWETDVGYYPAYANVRRFGDLSLSNQNILYVLTHGSCTINAYSKNTGWFLNSIQICSASYSATDELSPIIASDGSLYIFSTGFNKLYHTDKFLYVKWNKTIPNAPLKYSDTGAFFLGKNINNFDTLYFTDRQDTIYTFYYTEAPPPPSEVTVSCPIGWCYVGLNYTSKTLLELDNLFSTDTIQGRYNATSQKYESHRTGYAFNQHVTVQQKEGYYYYFTSAQDITMLPGSTPSITLKAGWSLVANYGTSVRTLSALKTSIGATATSVKYYDRTSKTWVSTDSQSVPAMENFFVYVTSQTEWSG